jgi:hypothetical protein
MPHASNAANAASGSCFSLNTVCLDKPSALAMADRLGGLAVKSKLDAVEHSPVIGGLASQVGVWLRSALMVDTGPLGGFSRLSLCLCCGCHEGDERIADGLLHRIRGAAIKRHAVDDRFDDYPAPRRTANVSPARSMSNNRLPSGRSASLVLTPPMPAAARSGFALLPKTACDRPIHAVAQRVLGPGG